MQFNFVCIVCSERHCCADVPLYYASSQDGTGCAQSDGLSRLQDSDALGAAKPDAVLRQQFFVIGDTRFEGFAEALDVFFERVVGLVLQPADAKRMRGQSRATIFLENL